MFANTNKITLLLFLLAICRPAMPFTLTSESEYRFPDSKITIDVSQDDCTGAGYNSPEDLLDDIGEAMDEYWNRIPTCALELPKGSVRNISLAANDISTAISSANAGSILVVCSTISDPAPGQGGNEFDDRSILALASIDPNNNNERGAVLINTNSTFADLDRQAKWATLAHEIGHAFGLGHSADPVALMYYSVGRKVQEALAMDDYDACTYLYPQELGASCGSVSLSGGGKSSGGGFGLGLSWALAALLVCLSLYPPIRRRAR